MSFSTYQYNPNTSAASAPPAPSNLHHDGQEGEEHDHCALAKAELIRYGFPSNHKAHIAIALDVSASMNNPNMFYFTGQIQKLIEKAMEMAIELAPGAEHTVTIFPFGEGAFKPVIIDEHDLHLAVDQVLASIGGQLSRGTNYNLVAKKIRNHYFRSDAKLTQVVPSDDAPVFCLFVTDGEPSADIPAAINQFNWSEYTAIFFKFIALKGKQEQLKKLPEPKQFETLKVICNSRPESVVPNKHLIVLDNPDQLTIQKLFMYYRTWVEEAYSHKILTNDPGINLNIKLPRDHEEIRHRNSLNAKHGHSEHGHINASHINRRNNQVSRGSNQSSIIMLGLLGAVILPLVITTTLPLWLMIGMGFGFGVATAVVYNAIYDCIFPTRDNINSSHHSANSSGHGSDDDSDDDNDHGNDHNSNRQLWNTLQSASHPSSSYVAYTPIVYGQPPHVVQQYQPLGSNNAAFNPNYPPPPYNYRKG